MSYNTDLQTNNTSLQEILATIESLPEAGGSSSGGVEIETCTVAIIFQMSPGASFSGVYCTVLQDGVINTTYIAGNNSTVNIDNVILNSAVIILANNTMMPNNAITQGMYGQSTIYNNIDGNGKVHIGIPTMANLSTNKCSINIGM